MLSSAPDSETRRLKISTTPEAHAFRSNSLIRTYLHNATRDLLTLPATLKASAQNAGIWKEHAQAISDSVKRFAQQTFPALTRNSPEVSERATRLISVPEIVKRQSDYYKNLILRDAQDNPKQNDPVFRQKLGAVAVEDQLRGIRQKFIDRSTKARERFDQIEDADGTLKDLREASAALPEDKAEMDAEQRQQYRSLQKEINYFTKVNDDPAFAARERYINEQTAAVNDAHAKNVTTVVGAEGSPFATEDDYKAALQDKDVSTAFDRYRSSLEPILEDNYRSSAKIEPEQETPARGADTDTHVSLKAIREEEPPALTSAGLKGGGNVRNTLEKHSPFEREAFGNAKEYDLDFANIIDHSINRSTLPAAQANFYKSIEESGLGVISKPGAHPTIDGQPTVAFNIKNRTLATGGAIIPQDRVMYVRADVAPEVRDALDIDAPIKSHTIGLVNSVINRITLMSSVEGIAHIGNHGAKLITIPLVPGAVGKAIMGEKAARIVENLPVVKLAGILDSVLTNSFKMMTGDMDTQRKLSEMANLGVLKPEHQAKPDLFIPKTINPFYGVSRLIDHLTTASRVSLYDAYTKMANAGWVDKSPNATRDFVNQVGPYHRQAAGKIARMMKDAGFSPFVTAGQTFTAQGIRSAMFDTGMHATSSGKALALRGYVAAQLLAPLIVGALNNYLRTGQIQPTGTPWGSIYIGKDKDGKPKYFDIAELVGLKRGYRAVGLDALIEGLRTHQTPAQIVDKAWRQSSSALVSPFAGPSITAGLVATTGMNPHGMYDTVPSVGRGESMAGHRIVKAIENVNPTVGAMRDPNNPGVSSAVLGKYATRTGSYPDAVPNTKFEGMLKSIAASRNAPREVNESPADEERRKLKIDLSDRLADPATKTQANADIRSAKAQGKLTHADELEITRNAKLSYFDRKMMRAPADSMKDLFPTMTPAEKMKYLTPDREGSPKLNVIGKIMRSGMLPAEKKDSLVAVYDAAPTPVMRQMVLRQIFAQLAQKKEPNDAEIRSALSARLNQQP